MLYLLLAVAGVISYLSIVGRYFPLKLAAGFFWLANLVYWLAEGGTYATRGSPTDTILTVAFIFPPIIFLLWGLSTRVGKESQVTVNNKGQIEYQTFQSNTKHIKDSSVEAEHRAELRRRLHRKG